MDELEQDRRIRNLENDVNALQNKGDGGCASFLVILIILAWIWLLGNSVMKLGRLVGYEWKHTRWEKVEPAEPTPPPIPR